MDTNIRKANRLVGESSPYLLQHAYNPVQWYPWGEEAFEKARLEDKPVFLSIGYSTCHWCHVMARESFEDEEIAALLNRYFVAVKVDKEERPDIDSVYMAVCQAYTGSGGWPTSIFMTAEQKPFFAGTYFPKTAGRYGPGLKELLQTVRELWVRDREGLLQSAASLAAALEEEAGQDAPAGPHEREGLIDLALSQFRQRFDASCGGFGGPPKFPAAHNLLFLMQQAAKRGDAAALHMAETTLWQMYRGGLFDHIGFGFCRYATDRAWLVPHFEKMLYDNALLLRAYCRAYTLTKKRRYLAVAEKVAFYVLSELTGPEGGFFCAQDADSEGREGGYYLLTPAEVTGVLGEAAGNDFCACFDITPQGNFEGQSIPNLLRTAEPPDRFAPYLPALRDYRRQRTALHTDDKCLTHWNSLMISALCALYRAGGNEDYLDAAKRARAFIEERLCQGDQLAVSFRAGKRGGPGFLDDYAAYAAALLALYDATLEQPYLERAAQMAKKAVADFFDREKGGFYLYGSGHAPLFSRPKESGDGALPSGNSQMAAVLARLSVLAPDPKLDAVLERQLDYLAAQAAEYPAGHTKFLMALSDCLEPPPRLTAVGGGAELAALPLRLPEGSLVRLLPAETPDYPLLEGKPSYYVCRERRCLPPTASLEEAVRQLTAHA